MWIINWCVRVCIGGCEERYSWSSSKEDLGLQRSAALKGKSMNGGRKKKIFAVLFRGWIYLYWFDREVFHMFISRTPREKQPSPTLSVLLAQGPVSAGYKNPSVSRWASIIVGKARSWKDSYSAVLLFVLLSASFLINFVHDVLEQLFAVFPQTVKRICLVILPQFLKAPLTPQHTTLS